MLEVNLLDSTFDDGLATKTLVQLVEDDGLVLLDLHVLDYFGVHLLQLTSQLNEPLLQNLLESLMQLSHHSRLV